MAKVQWKGGALLAPVPPALISCGTVENPNVLTVAWTGIINTQPPKTYISVRPERYSYDLIKNSGEFVINLPTRELVKAVDFCGVKSGKDTDKFKVTGLTAMPCSTVSAPQLEQSPLSLECKVFDCIELGTHHMFLADITAVNADEKLLDPNGRLALEKANLIAYAHGDYFELGKRLGDFGFSVRKKKTPPKKRPKKK
ncbi:MAG: flavin reductase family protein [Clostridia bacterium]|nr:flavin reductase family protein [Clostridia bacterium]